MTLISDSGEKGVEAMEIQCNSALNLLIQRAAYSGQFSLSRQKADMFSLKLTRLI